MVGFLPDRSKKILLRCLLVFDLLSLKSYILMVFSKGKEKMTYYEQSGCIYILGCAPCCGNSFFSLRGGHFSRFFWWIFWLFCGSSMEHSIEWHSSGCFVLRFPDGDTLNRVALEGVKKGKDKPHSRGCQYHFKFHRERRGE